MGDARNEWREKQKAASQMINTTRNLQPSLLIGYVFVYLDIPY